MLKQSRQHTNLPAGWQGKQPDYSKALGTRLTPDKTISAADIQAKNCRTIQRLQSALHMRRQHIAHSKRGSSPNSRVRQGRGSLPLLFAQIATGDLHHDHTSSRN